MNRAPIPMPIELFWDPEVTADLFFVWSRLELLRSRQKSDSVDLGERYAQLAHEAWRTRTRIAREVSRLETLGHLKVAGENRVTLLIGARYSHELMPYAQYLKTAQWAAIRKSVLERDNHRCRDCISTEGLQVHHLTYENRGHEELKELVTVCRACHRRRHGGGGNK